MRPARCRSAVEHATDDWVRRGARVSEARGLPVGLGAHFCLGAELARLEGRIALEEMLKRFPEWDVDLSNARLTPTSTVRGWEHLPLATP